MAPRPASSVPGVCTAELYGSGTPDWLIEVPHGATSAGHYQRLRAELRGSLPDDLIDFFHVNTDSGAPEYARALAKELAADRTVLVLISEIPRTFVDCNRVLDVSAAEYKA